ncbi:hypothetical protein ELE36_18675 [Pseudolysobacter antarcticus]|uniref:YfhO family protein n=1 Tax=Pseudolysobacter antarcticus TaxID=2511995 RepID=A0A411HP13_9GAMM|nr:hypothetical protein [Pseudolysobacter antarcticus]QBB72227.1 hypothetical protein ELE36_18675 [Pseudolysobacter antarcticus]
MTEQTIPTLFQRYAILVLDLLLVLIVTAYTAALYFSHAGAAAALNSDSVMPYVLFDDLVRHRGRFDAWVFPEAPFWLPDQLLIWGIYAAIGNLFHAIYVYAVIQAALYLLAVRWILRLLHESHGRIVWLLWILIWLITTAIGATVESGWFQYFHSYVFLPNNHAGTYLGAVVGLGLLLRGQRRTDNTTLVFLAVLSVGMLISDRLFALQFIAPALLLVCLPGDQRWRRWRIKMAIVLASLLLLSEVIRRLCDYNFLGIHASGDTALWRGGGGAVMVTRDFATLASTDPVSASYEFIAFGALIWCCARAWHRRNAISIVDAQQKFAVLGVFVAGSILLPLVAVVVLARHTALRDFRYDQSLALSGVMLAILITPAVIAVWQKRSAHIIAGAIVVCAGILAATITLEPERLFDFHTSQLACIRQAQQKYQLHFGFAQYWNAMSRMAQIPDLVVAPLLPNLKPHAYLNLNLDWFAPSNKAAAPSFEFIEESGLDPALLDTAFGTPVARVICPESKLRIYAADTGLLARLYLRESWLADRRLILSGHTSVPAAAWAKIPAQARADTVVVAGHYAIPAVVLAGTAYKTSIRLDDWPAYGIHAPTTFIAGTPFDVARSKNIWIDYQLQAKTRDAGLRWKVFALDKSGASLRTLGSGNLPPTADADQRELLNFATAPQDTDALGIEVQARGDIDARVYALGWGNPP